MRGSMKSVIKLAVMVLALVSVANGADAAVECVLTRVASLPMAEDHEGAPTVQVVIGGRTLTMLVNTGDALSILTEPAARSLGLTPQSFNFRGSNNYGGQTIDRYVVAHDMQIGALKSDSADFAFMPAGRMSENLDGAISSDILRHYDVEFDFANSTLNLYSPDHCPGQFSHWTDGEYAAVVFQLDRLGRIVIPVQLNGREVSAILHTGYLRSVMPFDEARVKLGLDEGDPKLSLLSGDSNGVRRYAYQFKTMTFQGIIVNNANVELVDYRDPVLFYWDRDLILGLGVLRSLHLYIAYREHVMYATPATAH
jgi:predicted aspartyl protease